MFSFPIHSHNGAGWGLSFRIPGPGDLIKAGPMHLSQPPSRLSSDVRCPICGQGFLIFAELAAHASQIESRRMIQQTLRAQHDAPTTNHPHPDTTFNIPSRSGAPFTASASLSDLLDSAI